MPFSSPAGCLGEGPRFCRACPLNAGPGFLRGLARGSRTHLAAAAPPQCRYPGRPRLSGGGPPAAQPGTGGPAQPPAGGLPCRGHGGGPIRVVRDGERTLCCGQFWTWRSHTRSSPKPDLPKPDSEAPVHTPVGSAQPGRTSRARSPPGPSAAAEPPSAWSRRRPTAPAWHGGLGGGASAGDEGSLRTGLPDAPCARPPPPRPRRLPRQPGVRDSPACVSAGLQTPGTAAQGLGTS